MFDVKEEVREEEGSTWTLCGQLSAWECHRAGGSCQEPGDTLTQTAAGDTQPAASGGTINTSHLTSPASKSLTIICHLG